MEGCHVIIFISKTETLIFLKP